jgi:hypothetical protein
MAPPLNPIVEIRSHQHIFESGLLLQRWPTTNEQIKSTGRRESSSINMSPSELPQLIQVPLNSEMAGRLRRWAESSGQSIEQIAHQLLRASITVLGDQSHWSVAPADEPPANRP